jgi:hypothetical protein
MEDFLASALFRYAIFPIGSALLGVAIKCVTRNDKYTFFRKEDMAVGIELLLTACLMFVVLTTDRAISLADTNQLLAQALKANPIDPAKVGSLQSQAQQISARIATAGWLILLMVIMLWSTSTIVRKWGWVSETELKPRIGIALPLGLGILALLAVMAGAPR